MCMSCLPAHVLGLACLQEGERHASLALGFAEAAQKLGLVGSHDTSASHAQEAAAELASQMADLDMSTTEHAQHGQHAHQHQPQDGEGGEAQAGEAAAQEAYSRNIEYLRYRQVAAQACSNSPFTCSFHASLPVPFKEIDTSAPLCLHSFRSFPRPFLGCLLFCLTVCMGAPLLTLFLRMMQLCSVESGVVAGFQMATAAGPLCDEPMWGVAFEVEARLNVGQQQQQGRCSRRLEKGSPG